MAMESAWRDRLWRTMAITGVSIVIYGVAQRALNFPSIFWPAETGGRTFFGSFHYHGNAGAFLNLIWPILLMLLARSFREQKAHLERALWSMALFLTLAGCLVNISRAAAAITVVLGVIGGIWLLPQARARRAPAPFALGRFLIILVVLGIFVAALVAITSHSLTAARWAQLSAQLNGGNQRLLADGACLRMLPEAGWFGFGPGTFSAVFPFHTSYLGYKIWGYWIYAHEDYLQTVIEYGRAGAALWAAYFLGGMLIALVRAFGSKSTTSRLGYAACFLALGGIAVHAFVDFPLQVPSIQLYVAVYLAVAWRVPGQEAAHALQTRRAPAAPGLEPA
jgi:O-antigen ligase